MEAHTYREAEDFREIVCNNRIEDRDLLVRCWIREGSSTRSKPGLGGKTLDAGDRTRWLTKDSISLRNESRTSSFMTDGSTVRANIVVVEGSVVEGHVDSSVARTSEELSEEVREV